MKLLDRTLSPSIAFVIGALAPILAYTIFFSGHFDLLDNAALGATGLVTASLLVILIAFLSGAWARWCGAFKLPGALSAGLALPAAILALSGAFAVVQSPAERLSTIVRTASLAPVFANGAAVPMSPPAPRWTEAFRVALHPVGWLVTARARAATDDCEDVIADLDRRIVDLDGEKQALLRDARSAAGRIRELEKRLDNAQSEIAAAAADSARLRADAERAKTTAAEAFSAAADLRRRADRAVQLERELERLGLQLSDAEFTVTQLRAQVDETTKDLSLTRTAQSQASDQVQELSRAFVALGQSAGGSAVNNLAATLDSAQGRSLKLAAIQALRTIPNSARRPEVRSRLEKLLSDPSPDVRLAARGLLEP